jgi:hypothetical protein
MVAVVRGYTVEVVWVKGHKCGGRKANQSRMGAGGVAMVVVMGYTIACGSVSDK